MTTLTTALSAFDLSGKNSKEIAFDSFLFVLSPAALSDGY